MMNIKYIRQISDISGISIPICLMILLVPFFLNFSVLKAQNKSSTGISTVVIDAGHGGKDPGAVVGKAREKDIVLDIALRLGKLIKQGLPDIKVIYTRNSDFFVPLFKRSVIANNSKASLFISIHANFCSSPTVKGTETYVLGLHRTQDNQNVERKENSVILLEEDYTKRYEGFDPNSAESYIIFDMIQNKHLEQSVEFAQMVQDHFQQHAQRSDRDVRQAGFLVLREAAMPSVLIETGYLSNKSEAAYLMTENGRETIAASIFRSLENYKSRFESRLTINSEEIKTKPRELNKNEVNRENDTDKIAENKEIKPEINQNKPTGVTKAGFKPLKKDSDVMIVDKYSFAIQISASKVKLSLNSKIFKGIENIKEIQVGEYYKYFCSEYKSLTKTNQSLLLIRNKIPDAFIIGLKNGQPVPFKEAVNHR
jgi:N-acetylmuramoyl-L-alanine amidase